MKLCIFVAYKFFTKYLNFGFSQCISSHVISQNMKFIRLAISQPFLKTKTFSLDQKYKIMCRTFHSFGVIKCISGHVTAH